MGAVTILGIALSVAIAVIGMVYIVNLQTMGTPTRTVVGTVTITTTKSATDPVTNTTSATAGVRPTNSSALTTTVTDLQVSYVTTTSTSLVSSGASTITSYSTDTVTRTVTTTSVATGGDHFAVAVISCLSSDPSNSGDASCALSVTDSGLPSTNTVGCSIQIGGVATSGLVSATDGGAHTSVIIPSNGTPVDAWCMVEAGKGGVPGSPVSGSLSLGYGDSLQFSADWQ